MNAGDASRHSPSAPPARVTLYTGAGCHLCEAAREVLEAVRREIPFDLQERPIDGDPELEARFRAELPVVFVDGQKHAKYTVEPDRLRRRLLARPGAMRRG
jgi:glutaredoxin